MNDATRSPIQLSGLPPCDPTIIKNESNLHPPLEGGVRDQKRSWDRSFSQDSTCSLSSDLDLDVTGDQAKYSDGRASCSPSATSETFAPFTDMSSVMDDEEGGEDARIKRKAQNRAAQRAFRERKERYVKELENKIKVVQDNHFITTTQLLQEIQHLKSVVYQLETENRSLKELNGNNLAWSLLNPTTASTTFMPPAQDPTSIPAPASYPLAYPTSLLPSTPAQAPSMPVPSAPSLPAEPRSQFTFAISTPATLRESHKAQKSQAEPIEPIQLYPGDSHPAAMNLVSSSSSLSATSPAAHASPASSSSSTASPATPHLTLTESATENEAQESIDAYLSDMVQDDMDTKQVTKKRRRTEPILLTHPQRSSDTSSPSNASNASTASTASTAVKPLSPVWQRINDHASAPKFNVDLLLEAVKNPPGCGATHDRLLDEWELTMMIKEMQ